MKYPAIIFAKSFYKAFKETPAKDHEKLFVNFAKILNKYGAIKNAGVILNEIEKIYSEDRGITRIRIETARLGDQTRIKKIKSLFNKKNCVFSEKVSPNILAGVKIRIDDEIVIDNSMQRRLKNLFKIDA
ncbi:MAG: hypothetical protein COU46_03415 [Candidatus Niyogibacteria bacterium CG10_big_fil_rev_8_21_14_0_10_42_19]|uniref:Uncharacterized protein n=1 Tax=Candidatus Niyogibacteria bacterium CG10_big_fil_rev_8_21_14_0_10_42_19 TaxID=1974725 RepID=A0A2H0TEX1_9BACT|nr:MAG: hypothetical protein COU46_03415 [Candidatus Niyogibacteria bacterium CG10_big_fil_rev_8_21_14_0_10_42_19]